MTGVEAVLLKAEIEALLHTEAARLGARDFSGWLELYTDDAEYWIPSNADDTNPSRQVSIIYDRRDQLAERVWRLESGLAYAQEPQSRASHLVGNVRLLEPEGDLIVAESVFNITEFRRSVIHVHAGRVVHHLRRDGEGLRIVRKKVELVNNDGHLGNLSILL
jgi:3-phenylpropionate/cinnamic acid dioxygenase small subunit